MAALAAHSFHQDRLRLEAMRKEIIRLREDMASSGGDSGHGEIFRQMLAAVPSTPAVEPSRTQAVSREAPRGAEEKNPRLTVTQMHDRINGIFTTERADPTWADGAQRLASELLRGALPEGSEVRSVECRAQRPRRYGR